MRHGVGMLLLVRCWPNLLDKDDHGLISVCRHRTENVMLPHAEWKMPLKWQFMQNNEPKHTARTVKKRFEVHNIDVTQWPVQSPDVNPIEMQWQIAMTAVNPAKSKNKEGFCSTILPYS